MVRYLLFDLDNTLYPSSSGLDREIDRLMTLFVADYLGVPPEEARRRRKSDAVPFGTTLTWLREAHGFRDEDRYLEAVHPLNVEDFIAYDPELPALLDRIDLPKIVLTNSPIEHAERVLARLGIADRFIRIIDIRYNRFCGKPHREAFDNGVSAVGASSAEEVLFIDDLPRYVLPFLEIGGQGLLVDETGKHDRLGHGLPTIRKITELETFLRR